MNKEPSSGSDHFRALQILDELSADDSLTQRDLSSRLGIALGLVNSYIKNLISKGYITVKAIPPKRYAYYLTPKGFAEKTRLTFHLLQDYTRVYREAKSNLNELFRKLEAQGVKKIVFAGSDEVAEIAYITLQETSLQLAAIVDTEEKEKKFFGIRIFPVPLLGNFEYDKVVLTAYVRRDAVHRELIKNGVREQDILSIFPAVEP